MTRESDPDEITKIDIKHPSKPPVARAELSLGGVGNVSVYAPGNKLDVLPKNEEKRPQGRPSKFTDEIKGKLLGLIEDGIPIKTSCALVGITTSTYQTWKGLAAKEEEDGEFARFFLDIQRARAVGEVTLFQQARQGDGREWSEGPSKSAKWILERSFGKDYAPRLNMKLEELGDITLDTIERVCGAKDCGCYQELVSALSAGEIGE